MIKKILSIDSRNIKNPKRSPTWCPIKSKTCINCKFHKSIKAINCTIHFCNNSDAYHLNSSNCKLIKKSDKCPPTWCPLKEPPGCCRACEYNRMSKDKKTYCAHPIQNTS